VIKKLNEIYRFYSDFLIEKVFRETLLKMGRINKEGNQRDFFICKTYGLR